ncbi:hypothetical protein [Virgibacillus halodenitrificans]|uniref:hypothetical protein n=1 Tax=Virgibacillus halodenitrificans TaxID=1482 RepID=UPI000B0737A3|nr:hypothetical protein [Virgibacillus halodenitrificans]
MKHKALFRAIYFAIGVLVAFILFRLDLPQVIELKPGKWFLIFLLVTSLMNLC